MNAKADTSTFNTHVNTKNPHGLGLGDLGGMPLSYWQWSGQTGQPTWLWGGNANNQYKVWNPSNFNVNYANSAGSAVDQTARNTANAAMPKNGGSFTGIVSFANVGHYLVFKSSGGNCTIAGTSDNWFDIRSPRGTRFLLEGGNSYVPAYASNTSLPSSKRYKNIIGETPPDRAARLYGLTVKDFTYKENMGNTGHTVTGLIAEEVEELMPEFVYHANGKTEGINYAMMLPSLLKLVQEQNERIAELEKRAA